MDLNIDNRASKDFPMYSQIIKNGLVIGCVYDSKIGCKNCIAKTMCKVKEVNNEKSH